MIPPCRSLADGNDVHWNVGPRFRNMVRDVKSQVHDSSTMFEHACFSHFVVSYGFKINLNI